MVRWKIYKTAGYYWWRIKSYVAVIAASATVVLGWPFTNLTGMAAASFSTNGASPCRVKTGAFSTIIVEKTSLENWSHTGRHAVKWKEPVLDFRWIATPSEKVPLNNTHSNVSWRRRIKDKRRWGQEKVHEGPRQRQSFSVVIFLEKKGKNGCRKGSAGSIDRAVFVLAQSSDTI